MKLDRLRELAKECRSVPHYQFKDLDEEKFMVMASEAFHKLPDNQQKHVIQSWIDELSIYGEDASSPENLRQLIYFRFLAQTNLYFLCKLLESYKDVTLGTHEDVCNDFFVPKIPNFSTFEKFANQFTPLKDRLLLVPRGGFKSSIDMADTVQYIVNWPDITIAIITGTLLLATDFVGEIKKHFTLEENGIPDGKTGKSCYGPRSVRDENDEWSHSLFQVLFIEHCVKPGESKQTEFQTPAGGTEKEPTVRAASIEQALSGAHFCVMKLDDVVTNENSLTADRIDKVNKQIGINRAMLHPFGFMDVIGTWYDDKDYYGKKIKLEIDHAESEGLKENIKGSVDSGRFESSVFMKVYLRAALWLNDEAVKAGKIEAEAKKADYDLWFPERLTYEFLIKERKTDPDGFPIKYLNNPRQLSKVKFPRELLMRRTIPHTQLPPQGVIVTTVDTAYSTKSWADYTVIMTSLIYGGRFHIINMVRGRFNEFDLPRVIAATAHKWKPKRIAIEDSVGVKWMGQELRREMNKLQISIPIEFVSLGLGSKAKAKSMKAKPVLRLLGDERLLFSNSCEGLEEIYSELEQFTGSGDEAHDDIVSALSLLADQFQGYADMGTKLEGVSVDFTANQQAKEIHDLIYHMGKYAHLSDDNPVTQFQISNVPQFGGGAGNYSDPFADLMG